MISVIVPVYNNASQLPRCLDSLLAQSCKKLQIVAVNDGSTDASGQVLDAYARRYPHILVLHRPHRGVSAARLEGILAARGACIGFADADDAADADMYERLIENMNRYSADISHCGFRMEFPSGEQRYFHNTGAVRLQTREESLRELLSGRQIEPSLCCKLFRRELFTDLSRLLPLDIDVNEDLLLSFILFSRGKTAVYEDFCPYRYIVRPDSASRRRPGEQTLLCPIRVREYLSQICPPALAQDVRRSWLSTCINVYNRTVLWKDPSLNPTARAVRLGLLSRRQDASLLSRRQRLAFWLICRMPWAYGPVYRLYAARFQKNPYV